MAFVTTVLLSLLASTTVAHAVVPTANTTAALVGIAKWTQSIEQNCKSLPEQKLAEPETALACKWPHVFNELNASRLALSSKTPADLTLELASGVYSVDLFQESTLSPDARVARFLFAIRMARQVWPFAEKTLVTAPLLAKAVARAAITTSDAWSMMLQAFRSLNCASYSACAYQKVVIIKTLAEAVKQIELDTTSQLEDLADGQVPTDALLAGYDYTQHLNFENLIGSFTNEGPSFYLLGAGDSTTTSPQTKLAELAEWSKLAQSDLAELFYDSTNMESDSCANLRTSIAAIANTNSPVWFPETVVSRPFICRPTVAKSDDQVSILTKPETSLRFTLLSLRRNLMLLLSSAKLKPESLKLMSLMHELRSFAKAKQFLVRPEIAKQLALDVKPNFALVDNIVEQSKRIRAAALTGKQ